jgi:DNA-binding NarL/FixJ family response regulator
MQHIIVFEQKTFMMKRINNILNDMPCKVYPALNYLELEHFLTLDLVQVDMIIAELNFDNSQEIEMITHYLKKYPNTKLVIFTSDLSRKAFLDSIKVGASDYIINNISDDEIKVRINQHISKKASSLIPTHLILNLNKYLSGELIKANKGNYKLTIAFSAIVNEKGLQVQSEDTSLVANFFSANYWDTDSIVIFGFNHMLSFFPFCTEDMIDILDQKLQHMFAACKSHNIHIAKYQLQNTYVTFPEEGLTVEDILKIVRRKIEKSTLTAQ